MYTFSAYPANPEHRFDLHFAPTTGIEKGKASDINIYSFGKNIFVNIHNEINGQVIVYNMLGQEMYKSSVTPNFLNKIDLVAPEGYYLVKVITDGVTASEKVIIK